MTKKRTAGRNTTGLEGAKASEYRRLTVRMPAQAFAHLSAASRATGWPQWRVITAAAAAYIGAGEPLSDAQKAIARAVLKLPGE